MANATTTTLGHVSRAIQFFNESEIFMAVGKSTSWPIEGTPPAPDVASRNVGLIVSETYVGTSFSSSNAIVKINRNLYTGATKTYRVKALTSTTYEVREIVSNVIQGSASYAVSSTARTDIILGVDIKITGTLVANDTYTFTIDGIIGFKKVNVKHLVIPDNVNGTIIYGANKYSIVNEADAYDQNARWVYIETSLDYNELPTNTSFRQIGVYTNLVRNNGVVADTLLPSQVTSSGLLVEIENRKPVYRDDYSREIIAYVIEH